MVHRNKERGCISTGCLTFLLIGFVIGYWHIILPIALCGGIIFYLVNNKNDKKNWYKVGMHKTLKISHRRSILWIEKKQCYWQDVCYFIIIICGIFALIFNPWFWLLVIILSFISYMSRYFENSKSNTKSGFNNHNYSDDKEPDEDFSDYKKDVVDVVDVEVIRDDKQ